MSQPCPILQVREALRSHHQPPETGGVDRGTRRERARAMEAGLVHDLCCGENFASYFANKQTNFLGLGRILDSVSEGTEDTPHSCVFILY